MQRLVMALFTTKLLLDSSKPEVICCPGRRASYLWEVCRVLRKLARGNRELRKGWLLSC